MKSESRQFDRKSLRLKEYDYSLSGGYFITICTHHNEHVLGEIIDGVMNTSPIGEIIKECWLGLPDHFSRVTLDEYIIMPNHIHGILILAEPVGARKPRPYSRLEE